MNKNYHICIAGGKTMGRSISQVNRTKIGMAVITTMLFSLLFPVMAYSANKIQVYYDAESRNISGVIYQDNGEGGHTVTLSVYKDQWIDITEDLVILNPVHTSEGEYSIEFNGRLREGLHPEYFIIGDTYVNYDSVTDSVYAYVNDETPDAPGMIGLQQVCMLTVNVM
jgi:hypothetical protein